MALPSRGRFHLISPRMPCCWVWHLNVSPSLYYLGTWSRPFFFAMVTDSTSVLKEQKHDHRNVELRPSRSQEVKELVLWLWLCRWTKPMQSPRRNSYTHCVCVCVSVCSCSSASQTTAGMSPISTKEEEVITETTGCLWLNWENERALPSVECHLPINSSFALTLRSYITVYIYINI